MALYKVKVFDRFARRHRIADADLAAAAAQLLRGSASADLGGGLYKLRIARAGGGKAGGYRTLVTHVTSEHCFFVHGFEKSAKANINASEERALKLMARSLGALGQDKVERALAAGELVEIRR